MKCAIHQPNFIPYIGFFNKMAKSDVFVLYDTAQYSKNEFHNRNKIKTSNGLCWLTVPVSVTFGQRINEVKICDNKFINKHLKTIKLNYSNSKYFNDYFPQIEKIYKEGANDELLVDFNIRFLRFFVDFLGLDIKIVKTSELSLSTENKSTDAIVEILKKVNSKVYLSGAGAKSYLDSEKIMSNQIELLWHNFIHPIYHQQWGDFEINLSILDLLFNEGENSRNLILKN